MKPERPPQIANPCPQSWSDMAGDARRRFCDHCQLHVHNLSAMTAREREGFLATDEPACVTFHTDAEGMLRSTRDLPWFAQWMERLRGAFVTMLATFLPLGFLSSAAGQLPPRTMGRPAPPKSSTATPSPTPTATPSTGAATNKSGVMTGFIGTAKSRE